MVERFKKFFTIYFSPPTRYWPDIDNALRKAAIENKVSIKLLISYWNSSRPSEDYFLRSLADLSESYKGVDIQVVSLINQNHLFELV